MSARDRLFMGWLATQGYRDLKALPGERWAGTFQFMFTSAVIVGRMGDQDSYADRWCYHTRDKARDALARWDGEGEPTGWHRHPASGRRVAEDGTESVRP